MKTLNTQNLRLAVLLAITGSCAFNLTAGTPQKWDSLPEPVRAAVLANGGTSGQSVDKEPGKKDGKAIYEAGVKDKDGSTADLVITEDGKLVETKHDDAADLAQERLDQAKKVLSGLKFSHPLDISNPFLPMSTLKQDILSGTESGKKIRIERTVQPDMHHTFVINGKKVEAFVVEDREFEDGHLAEVAIDYFAQADDGTVCYLGEDVDEYENDKLKGHEGSWMFGRDTQIPGIILPGKLKVGAKFKSEDVSKDITEEDEVLSLSETVTTPAGTYQNCVKVKEVLADGAVEYKFYAKGVGVVREVPAEGDVLLTSHKTVAAK